MGIARGRGDRLPDQPRAHARDQIAKVEETCQERWLTEAARKACHVIAAVAFYAPYLAGGFIVGCVFLALSGRQK